MNEYLDKYLSQLKIILKLKNTQNIKIRNNNILFLDNNNDDNLRIHIDTCNSFINCHCFIYIDKYRINEGIFQLVNYKQLLSMFINNSNYCCNETVKQSQFIKYKFIITNNKLKYVITKLINIDFVNK